MIELHSIYTYMSGLTARSLKGLYYITQAVEPDVRLAYERNAEKGTF